ncbi:metallophosphoesterase [Muricauda ruestringensis]|uniref:Metallophosphoesterase n=1 Tax=Flagellimonas aurea TaxID=2915619 RepID=A0ABS3G0V5_9FLAO|nr:metallophosphoesterase [Allomuricauda aurea]MAO17367.1 hypothetical protein [Allomuricauda sp.]MBO0353039.1 metallophosphoesterase [Allomuricauda aurea]
MKILHLTDYHFAKSGPKSIQKQKDLVLALLKAIKDLEFDFIIFSGDLVHTGSESIWFREAFDSLIKPILELKQKSISDVFFCQGNHDVDRTKIREPFIKYLDEEITTEDDLNDFSDYSKNDFTDTLESSKNYFDFISGLNFPKEDYLSEMYTVHKRSVNGLKLGIVSINTSWRSTGNDENKLLFPTKFIYESIEKIEGVDRKILVHHHPLSFLESNNQYVIEDIIHNKFDLTFFGHIHKSITSLDYTPKTGLIKIISPASLKYHQGGEIGFSLINFDFDESRFMVDTLLYDERNNFFYKSPNQIWYEIPEDEITKKQNSFRRTLRKVLRKEKELAQDLFVSFSEKNKSFIDVFVSPILKKHNFGESKSKLKSYNLDDIIKDDNSYLIFGDDKCGKTSLLKKIQIELLENYEYLQSIPFFVDFRVTQFIGTKEEFEKKFRNYYDLNTNTTRELLGSKNLILLLDNFDLTNQTHENFVRYLIDNYPLSKIVGTSEKGTEFLIKSPGLDGNEFIPLKFENLRKKQVRALTKKWTPLDTHKTEEVVTKISSIFKQLSIPFNFWTVSLFLWVFKKSGEKSIQNNVGLVNLYIESLLERENLIKSNANFDYDKYLKLLSHLAYHLLVNYHKSTYSAPELEILNFIGDYLRQNPRNKKVSPVDVWEYLKERGIFKKVDDDNYSFRLNGVFEYFLGYHMKVDPKFKEHVLESDQLYITFKNEFEIYAGLSRSDEAFLDAIFEKSKVIFESLNTEFDTLSLDKSLNVRARILPNYERKMMELSRKTRSLTFEELDELDELANELDIDTQTIEGVKQKQAIELNQEDIGVLDNALFILGRVFRNIDEINSEKKVKDIFNYYIKSVCQWGLRIIDTSKAIDFQTKVETEDEIDLLYDLTQKIIPYVVQTSASNHILHRNLEGIILDRIELLKKDHFGKENQFELFVLLFMLVDLNIKGNNKFIKEASELITIPVLRFAILLKLNEYLVFKTNEDKELERMLGKAIQNQRLKINKTTDRGLIQQEISDQKKRKRLGS